MVDDTATQTPAGGLASYQPEFVALDDMKPHPRNYRQHPDDQIQHLVQSLTEHGFFRNVILARDGTILAGHGVVQAARKLGYTSAPAVRLPLAPLSPRALKVLAADNELGHLAEVDDRALSELLKEVKELDLDGLFGTGYDEAMLANLAYVTRPASELRTKDEAAEWAGLGMPTYSPEPAPLVLIVKFASEDDRADLAARLGLSLSEKTRSTWWPPREQDDVKSVRLEQ